LKKFAQTTVTLLFDVDQTDLPDNVNYERNQVSPGFLCHLIEFEGEERSLLIPVKQPNWFCSARPHEFEEVNAMEFLAEVHAGNVPDDALEELS
jgi:hypothetical protein